MRLASMFLKTLNESFEPSDIKRAFTKTNQLFLLQGNAGEEDIRDLLDVCQEFFPQTYLTENEEYRQLWNCLEIAYLQEKQECHYK